MSGNGYASIVAYGAITTLTAQVIRILSTITAAIISSRFITPSDYGVFAMATPVLGFALLFQNIGFDQAIVQAKEISAEQLSSLFWINIGLCLFIALLVISVAPLVGYFYGSGDVGLVVAASSLLIIATAPNPLYCALLSRSMRYHAQNITDIASSLTMLLSTTLLSALLHSYWALFLSALLATIANFVSYVMLERWRPRLVFNWAETVELIGFGAGVSAFGMSAFFVKNTDNVLIGAVWGAQALGFYDRAYKLMLSPLQNFSGPLIRLLQPVLARTRDEPARYRRVYLISMQAISTIIIPPIVVAAFNADTVVSSLLGSQWKGAQPIFFWLAATAPLLIVNETAPVIFITTRALKTLVRWGVFQSITVIIGFVIGIKWGAVGVARAYFVGETLRTPLLFFLATQKSPLNFTDLMSLHISTISAILVCIYSLHTWEAINGSLLGLFITIFSAYTLAIIMQFTYPLGREMMQLGCRMILGVRGHHEKIQ